MNLEISWCLLFLVSADNMSTEAPVHYNKVVPNNVRDSKKNIITLHSKILTLTDVLL